MTGCFKLLQKKTKTNHQFYFYNSYVLLEVFGTEISISVSSLAIYWQGELLRIVIPRL